MATRKKFKTKKLRKKNKHLSALKLIIETAFYGNNVNKVDSIKEAYELALKQPQTIILDKEIANAEDLGLPEGAKMLVDNGSSIVGRTAKARHIFGENPETDPILLEVVMDAVYDASKRSFLKGEAVVGLDEDFMLRAHLMLPKDQASNLYSWLINFQIFNEDYKKRYENSKEYDENDIYIIADPSWENKDYPDGLVYFDTKGNVAIILGLQYFGELKKGTLTLAWGTAARRGYTAAHGGLKKFIQQDKKDYVAAFFGLSGSGKSTLTHAKHEDKYNIKVLHDDAFIINQKDGSSIALEPSYFDKTNDYPAGHPEQDYFITIQNVGVTLDKHGNRVLVTEDIRNGNGRTVKSRYSTPNRVDKINESIDAIYWIMKDNTLPPIIKIKDPIIASVMGCTLMTKRSSAENVENIGEAVIEPYANPFRVYPLIDDYEAYKALFKDKNVACYIINTGTFMNKDIPVNITLKTIENNLEEKGGFLAFDTIEEFEYLPIKGYEIPFANLEYRQQFKDNMKTRISAVKDISTRIELANTLPEEIIKSLKNVVKKI